MDISVCKCEQLLRSPVLADVKRARDELVRAPDSPTKYSYLNELNAYIQECEKSGLVFLRVPVREDFRSIACIILAVIAILGIIGAGLLGLLMHLGFFAVLGYASVGLSLLLTVSIIRKHLENQYLQACISYATMIRQNDFAADVNALITKRDWILENFDSLFPSQGTT